MPIDLASLIVGVVIGFTVYWFATHVDEWYDNGKERSQHAHN